MARRPNLGAEAPAAPRPGRHDLSIDLWIKTTDTGNVTTIVDKRSSSAGQYYGYLFFLYKGCLALQLADGGWTNYVAGTAGGTNFAGFVADGKWHLVAVTVDRDDPQGVRWYIDGVEVGTRRNPSSCQGNLDNSAPFYIGRQANGSYIDATMEEIEVFNRSQVVEVLRAAAVEPPPKATDVVEGVLNVRGTITPVLDLRRRLGLPPKALRHSDHFIVARVGERYIVVRTDRVTDLLHVQKSEVHSSDEVVPGAEYVSGVASLPEGLLLIYDLASFLSSTEVDMVAEAILEAASAEKRDEP